ncbi:MAG TPA: hypothetical protein VHC69_23905 [Polyangiaceae bacterium]|nr:hypothetical protein [Polyangiaceae bacterium]
MSATWRRLPARLSRIVPLLGAALVTLAGTALAEDRPVTTGLAAAEQAYQNVDFDTMHAQATSALAAGGAARDEAARLYVLAGISAAALGQDDEAKQAFVVALAVDPTLKLDRNLSPKIRGPYLEAEGFWGAYTERLGLRAHVAADGGHLLVELADPGRLAAQVALHVRLVGSTTYEAYTAEPAHTVRFSLPEGARRPGYEYFASVLDAHENVLAELGSDADPEIARSAPMAPAPRGAGTDAPPTQRRSYLLPAALGGAGLVAAAVGVVFHVERESAAHEWNGPHCEQPTGQSRLQQCGDVDSRRRFDQAMAIGAYSAAGLLLTAGAVTFFMGRSPSSEHPSPAAHAGLVGCGVAGTAVSCAGRF